MVTRLIDPETARRVRMARAGAQLTRDELAVKVGVHRDLIRRIEIAERPVEVELLRLIAEATEVRYGWLVGVGDSPGYLKVVAYAAA